MKVFNYLSLILIVTALTIFSCEKENEEINIFFEHGTFTDSRDGNTYKTVTLNGQTWMAENLKYLPRISEPSVGSRTTSQYYVYDYNGTNISEAKSTDNYNTYGVIYNWPAAMNSCPSGWHLPNDDEWQELVDYLGGEDVGGGKLKEVGNTHWSSPNTGASNESGFAALPGGQRMGGGTFIFKEKYGFWWSSTKKYSHIGSRWALGYNASSISQENPGMDLGSYVRCIKD